jgi:peptidoglycan/xylan/chitin deacetylase (PgdA/CDA1 family)
VHWTVARKLQPGAIVCLHGSSEATVAALPLILDTLQDEGYTAVTLSELLSPD